MTNSTSTYIIEAGVIEVTQEWHEIYSNMPRPDPEWKFADKAGHEHSYDNGYPTLKWVVDETYWCGECRDEHEEEHQECRECGEHITPKALPPSMFPERIRGERHITLDGRPISKEECDRLINESIQATLLTPQGRTTTYHAWHSKALYPQECFPCAGERIAELEAQQQKP